MIGKLSRRILWLDMITLTVFRNIDYFNIQNEFLEMSVEPTHPVNYLKVLGYGGIVVLLLCYYLMSEHKSTNAQRLCGVTTFASVAIHLWNLISPVPVSYQLCFLSCIISLVFLYTVLPDSNHLRKLLGIIGNFLDMMLCSVGEHAENMKAFLEWFDIKTGFDISGLYVLWLSSSSTGSNYLKVICYGGFLILICYFAMLKNPSIKKRLFGATFLFSFGYLLWNISTPLSFWSRVCFVGVSDLLLAGLAMALRERDECVWQYI